MANVARLGGYGDTSGSGLMFRNKLINGGFDIWQRGTSQTSNAYGSDDRWSNEHNGSTKTVSRQTFTVGQTDVPGNPKFWSRTVVSSVAGASNFVVKGQKIESVATLSGQNVSLSFWAKADATKNMAVEFTQNFGSGGSPSAIVNSIGVTTINLTTSWRLYTVNTTIPSISGKTLGTDGNDSLGVFFWFDAGSSLNARTNSLGQQSGTFDIANVQLEAGDQPTPFEQRPIGQELLLCQRYYETGSLYNLSGTNVNGGGSVFLIKLLVQKRAAGSGTYTAAANIQPGGFTLSAGNLSSVSTTTATFVATSTSGSSNSASFYINDATCSYAVQAEL